MQNKTLIAKLAKLLDTTTVAMSLNTLREWNNLADRQRQAVLRILLAMVTRTGCKRLTDMDYCDAMSRAIGC